MTRGQLTRRIHEIATSEPLVVFPPHYAVFDDCDFIIPPLRALVQSSSSRSRRTGRSREFLFSQGVAGKSRRASGRKGVTNTSCRYFLFLVVHVLASRLILPARGIRVPDWIVEPNGRTRIDHESIRITFKSLPRRAAPGNFAGI